MNKEQFIETLSRTGRKGVDLVIAQLEEIGFFEAPASTKFHLSCKGGLLEHQVNVYEAAVMLREQVVRARPELGEQLPMDSVAICALLHDVCIVVRLKVLRFSAGPPCFISRNKGTALARTGYSTIWTTSSQSRDCRLMFSF